MNLLAIVIAAASSFMVGGLWYAKALFGAAWNAENGGNMDSKQGHPAKVFGISFAFSLVAAIAFGMLVGAAPGMEAALRTGLLAGVGIAATSFGINYQFASRSFKLFLIDGGYHVVQFVLFGLVFGLVH